jgi:hypothetical protein
VRRSLVRQRRKGEQRCVLCSVSLLCPPSSVVNASTHLTHSTSPPLCVCVPPPRSFSLPPSLLSPTGCCLCRCSVSLSDQFSAPVRHLDSHLASRWLSPLQRCTHSHTHITSHNITTLLSDVSFSSHLSPFDSSSPSPSLRIRRRRLRHLTPLSRNCPLTPRDFHPLEER